MKITTHKEKLQEMIDSRFRNVRRLKLEIKDLENELISIEAEYKYHTRGEK